jgi:hypothetical protein
MRWLRANIRLGVACAYFALAVQIVLSFDHLHVDAVARLAQAAPMLAQSGGDGLDLDSGPRPQPHQSSDDDCPICALIHLAGSMLPVSAPSPSLPTVIAHVAPAIGLERAPELLVSSLFQARAPPIA